MAKESLNDLLYVGSAVMNYNLACFTRDRYIPGFEFLVGIPGSIGGGIKMNAGAYGNDFSDIIYLIEVVDFFGNRKILTRDQVDFLYRKSINIDTMIIVGCFLYPISLIQNIFQKKTSNDLYKDYNIFFADTFQGKKNQNNLKAIISNKMSENISKRDNSQPRQNVKTGGSTFINPSNSQYKAWQLIDGAGLRGYKIGGMMVSDIHCNFLINYDNASIEDAIGLIKFIQDKVFTNSGILLKTEIKFL
ncbi:MAG TPA: UDP-N-acetylmuramate dehydrogenase [Candidatus Megaira endosymbiont of Hartmannula sinica]|nr:UDP-N-acetylmuramate dehydrogenase [Candidatus Megaera endosymbiont of Hartmannula sinica]